MGILWNQAPSVTSDSSMIRYTSDSETKGGITMLEIDEKAMAYCLVEALFAAGVINLPTYQNFLRMKREQEEEPPAKAS